jgi:hypothetical protein
MNPPYLSTALGDFEEELLDNKDHLTYNLSSLPIDLSTLGKHHYRPPVSPQLPRLLVTRTSESRIKVSLKPSFELAVLNKIFRISRLFTPNSVC